jgi:hypothetical protein
MQFHPHLHVIITAGGLSADALRFIDKSDKGYLVPVKVLSRLYRGIFIDALDKSAALPTALKSALYKTEFFCYLKEPLDCAGNIVKYLARYANRVCISDSRVVKYDKAGDNVTFSYRDNKDGGKKKEMTVSVIEFMRRFLLHTLPMRFMKIRHYGILANYGKAERVSRCRRMLNANEKCFATIIRKPFQAVCKKCGNALPNAFHLSALELNAAMIC